MAVHCTASNAAETFIAAKKLLMVEVLAACG